jgi:hypothetical protein
MQLSERLRRRKSVKETDKTTMVGRMITRMLQRHVQRKLKKAETMFAKKLQRKRLKDEKEQQQRQHDLVSHRDDEQPEDTDPDNLYGYNDYENNQDTPNTSRTDELTTTSGESSPLLLPRGGSTLSGRSDKAPSTTTTKTANHNNNNKKKTMLTQSQSSSSLDSSGSEEDTADDIDSSSSSSSMSDGGGGMESTTRLASTTTVAGTRTARSILRMNNDATTTKSDNDEEGEVEEEHEPGRRRQRRPRRPSFHTDPTNRMQSIAHDQILFQRIQNMPYTHGGFFATAPFLLANPHWISILRHLMPDVYFEIARRAAYSPASKLIHWAENNPVVAAYGAAQEMENHYVPPTQPEAKEQNDTNSTTTNKEDGIAKSAIPNLEWDVFLDPYLVQRVEVVLQERDKYLAAMQQEEQQQLQELSDPTMAVVDDATKIRLEQQRNAKREQHRNILAYYEYQLKRRSQAMVDKMLIAHGNLNHLIIEVTGWAKHYNYSRVKRTRRTLGGGIFARHWLAVFAEALKLGNTGGGGSSSDDMWEDPSTTMDGTATRTFNSTTNVPSTTIKTKASGKPRNGGLKRASYFNSSLWFHAESKCPEMTMAEAVYTVQSICRCSQPIGLVLDLKSRHVPKRIWAIVVDTLRYAGVRVEGLGSFALAEIGDVSSYCVTGPVREICFFHSAGDMQRACHAGKIRLGDTVLLNAGSLLWEPSAGSVATKVVKTLCTPFDPEDVKNNYKVLSFGLPPLPSTAWPQAASNDDNSNNNNTGGTFSLSSSTLAAYKKKYQLSIGLYCQEFAIDEAAVNLLAKLVNGHPEIYNLGLSWGGVNGITLRGISPGRFTATDGFWNQRAIGSPWDYSLTPPSDDDHNDDEVDDTRLVDAEKED